MQAGWFDRDIVVSYVPEDDLIECRRRLKTERVRRRRSERKVRELFLTFLKVQVVEIVVVILFLVGSHFSAKNAWHDEDWKVDTYYVEKGDTLWEIGREVAGNKVDVREWIYEVEKLNEMDNGTTLQAHSIIWIYVPAEGDE